MHISYQLIRSQAYTIAAEDVVDGDGCERGEREAVQDPMNRARHHGKLGSTALPVATQNDRLRSTPLPSTAARRCCMH